MKRETYNNVWDALAFDESTASNLKIRSRLMMQIAEKIREKRYSQNEAASILRVTQPRVSNLMNGHIDKFSIDELVNMLQALDITVEIKMHDKTPCAA